MCTATRIHNNWKDIFIANIYELNDSFNDDKKKYDMNEIARKIKKGNILFFDLDGTLVETNYANFLAYNKALKLLLNKSIIYNPQERFTREKLSLTFPALTREEIKNIIEKKEIFYEDYVREIKLNTAMYHILNYYHTTNRIFLVTNCRKDRALKILQHYNLYGKFEKIFYQKCDNGKMINKFKHAISYLNIIPETVIVFENEQSEIMNAVDAGIPEENIILIN